MQNETVVVQNKTVVDAHCCFGFLNFKFFLDVSATFLQKQKQKNLKFKKPKQRGTHNRFILHNERFILHFVKINFKFSFKKRK